MKTWTRALPFASVLAANGCLMPPPPDLADPERTRPYVHYLNVDPPLGEPIQVAIQQNVPDPEPPAPIPILLPFQSEDLGEDVEGVLHLVRPNNSVKFEGDSGNIPAGEFSTVRNARMDWDPSDRAPGCYRLVATLAHASSFGAQGVVREDRLDDAEAVSWLANVYDESVGNITKLDDCPRVGDVD